MRKLERRKKRTATSHSLYQKCCTGAPHVRAQFHIAFWQSEWFSPKANCSHHWNEGAPTNWRVVKRTLTFKRLDSSTQRITGQNVGCIHLSPDAKEVRATLRVVIWTRSKLERHRPFYLPIKIKSTCTAATWKIASLLPSQVCRFLQ